MVPGPGDEIAAGRGLRASDADRDQAVDVLTDAFVQGRLVKDEFDLRVGRVLAARTLADLAILTAGIPAGPTPQGPVPASAAGVPIRRRGAPELIAIARMVRTRRRLVFLGTGLLLLFGGLALASTVAFISGMLVVAATAPPALPCAPEAATVRTWLWLHRRRAGHPSG